MSNENVSVKVTSRARNTPESAADKKEGAEGGFGEALAAFGVFLGEAILFTGLVGVALVLLGLFMELGLGIWAIPVAVGVGSGLKMVSDYFIKRSQNQTEKFSPLGAVLGYPVQIAA